jgi:protocatechuate 3,4-dioxygenase beta subunit
MMLVVIRLLLVLVISTHPLVPQTARVEGIVRTPTGESVPRATIQLVSGPANFVISPNGDRGLAGFTTTTDDSGKFVLENVPPGRNYRLLTTKAGFLDASLPEQLTLTEGDRVRDLVVVMGEQGVVTGRITDVNGNPLVEGLVTLQQSRYTNGVREMASITAQTTDDRGVYRFANLSPGRYYVVANDQTNRREGTDSNNQIGRQVNIRTYYPSADTIDAAHAIDLPGNRAQSTDILMRRAAAFALRGRVTDEETGAAISGARVLIVTVNGSSIRANPYSRITGSDGAFEFSGMPPASYVLEVPPPPLPGATRRIGRAEAVIVSSDVSGVALRVGNGVSIRGMVRLEQGSLPPSFFSIVRSVVLTEGTQRPALRLRGRVMSDGTFTIDALPGSRYLVSFTELPDDLYLKSISFGDSSILHSSLDLSSVREGSLTITLSNKPAVIEGSVRNTTGDVVKGMAVAVWPKEVNHGDPTGGIRRVVTDQNGTYRFAALAPGEYYVAAFPGVEQGLLESHEFVSKFNSESARVELSENARSKLDAPILPAERIAAEVAKLP